jgi:NAD(P)H-flavin reductase
MSSPRKLRCTVTRIVDHGDRVYTVELLAEQPVPNFKPGQFLHLALDDYDPAGFWPESRVFSIASTPQAQGRLQITYAVKGCFTARMEQELQCRRTIWVKLPYGDFVVEGTTDAVLIAGGTGITAFQAFITSLPSASARNVLLLYGARRVGLLLHREVLSEQQLRTPSFRAFFFSEEPPDTRSGIYTGRVQMEVLKDCALSPTTIYYLAGPPAMLTFCKARLTTQGISASNIRVDAWE